MRGRARGGRGARESRGIADHGSGSRAMAAVPTRDDGDDGDGSASKILILEKK